jgi:hypothetical protein
VYNLVPARSELIGQQVAFFAMQRVARTIFLQEKRKKEILEKSAYYIYYTVTIKKETFPILFLPCALRASFWCARP